MVRPESQAIVPMIEEAVVRPDVLPMNLLVVDDEQYVRQVCADVAVQSGMRVTTVSTTEEAISILENSAVDILMTDLKLPKSSGLDLLQCVHDQHREVAVSGAGKEMVGRSIHYSGPRKDQPFAPVDFSFLFLMIRLYARSAVFPCAKRYTSLCA